MSWANCFPANRLLQNALMFWISFSCSFIRIVFCRHGAACKRCDTYQQALRVCVGGHTARHVAPETAAILNQECLIKSAACVYRTTPNWFIVFCKMFRAH